MALNHVPVHTMVWIAGVFPLFSLVAGFVVQYWLKRTWISTLIVFVLTFGSMFLWFTLKFWSWVLLYLFLCWFGAWAAHYLKTSRTSGDA